MRRFPRIRAIVALLLAGTAWGTLYAAPREFLRTDTAAQGGTPANNAKTWFSKGQVALQSGDLDSAEEAFRSVLAADPNSGAAYANLGVIAMRRKDWDEALKNLKKAEKLSPRMAGVRLDIGLVDFRRGNYADAIVPLESVVRDEPRSAQARYLLATALEQAGPAWRT